MGKHDHSFDCGVLDIQTTELVITRLHRVSEAGLKWVRTRTEIVYKTGSVTGDQ